MSNEDWKIQVSPKTPAGTLVNIRGNTPEEVQALISGVHELVVLITSLERAFGGVAIADPLSTGATTGFPTQPPASNQVLATAPVASGPTCAHGARKFVQGKSAKGPWSAWMCPTVKDAPDKCPPAWA